MNQTSILLLVVASAAGLMGWAPAALVSLPELALGAQPWRLVSGHFAHADLNHWMMNSAGCLLYTSPSPRDLSTSRMPSSA